jgi:hypothetical protein
LKKKLIAIISLTVVSALISAALFIDSSDISRFLSRTLNADANVLIVEGWIPDYAVHIAAGEAQNESYRAIVTTGIRSSDLEYLTVGMNGYLIFYPGIKEHEDEISGTHSIQIVAKSKMGGKYCAHFTMFVNDTPVEEFSADDVSRKYGVKWQGRLNEIDSIMIHFDNDMLDAYGDVNLYVKELIIDSTIIIPYEFHSVYDIGYLDGKERIKNDFRTVAELARNKLIREGIDSSKIFAFPAYKKGFNRTLSSVFACKRGLKSLNFKITGVNVITLGIHSRRTWLTYKNILDNSMNIGVISVPEKPVDKEEEFGTGKIIREVFNLVYYSILLIPFYLI